MQFAAAASIHKVISMLCRSFLGLWNNESWIRKQRMEIAWLRVATGMDGGQTLAKHVLALTWTIYWSIFPERKLDYLVVQNLAIQCEFP
jgi:hypothetical protein